MAKNKVTVTWDGGARERKEPKISADEGSYRNLLADNTVHYSDFDVVPDMNDPANVDKRWIKLQSGWYIATSYPSSSGISQRALVEPVALPPVEPLPVESLNVAVTRYADGTKKVVVDGEEWKPPTGGV